MSVDRETIYERFGFVVEDDLKQLVDMARKGDADDRESLLIALSNVEELEDSAGQLRRRIEDAREKTEPWIGWHLVHKTHIERAEIEVCVKSEPFVHRFGVVTQIDDDGFVLRGFSISQGLWRHGVSWPDVVGAWRHGEAPELCPVCAGAESKVVS